MPQWLGRSKEFLLEEDGQLGQLLQNLKQLAEMVASAGESEMTSEP